MIVTLNVDLPPEGLGSLLLRLEGMVLGIRADVREDFSNVQSEPLEGLTGFFAENIFLLAGGEMTHDNGEPWQTAELIEYSRQFARHMVKRGLEAFNVEIGNEPDIAHDHWRERPAVLAQVFRQCYEAIKAEAPLATILTPSVSNLNDRGFDYLEAMMETGEIPANCELAFHRYPPDTNATAAHTGFSSRGDEVWELKKLAGNRRLSMTETGWTEGPWVKKRSLPCFEKESRMTEREVADTIRRDMEFWQSEGLHRYNLYQLNDGDRPDNYLDHFGIRAHGAGWEDPWKVIADRLPSYLQEFSA